MSIRVYEPERKEEILKVIEDNGFPLEWEDGVDAGIVSSTVKNYNFNLFDEEVLKLDEVFEEPVLTVIPVYTNENPVPNIQFDPDVREYMKGVKIESDWEKSILDNIAGRK